MKYLGVKEKVVGSDRKEKVVGSKRKREETYLGIKEESCWE